MPNDDNDFALKDEQMDFLIKEAVRMEIEKNRILESVQKPAKQTETEVSNAQA